MNKFEQLAQHHQQLRRGLTLMPAGLLDLAFDALAQEVLESVGYEGADEDDHIHYLRPRDRSRQERFDQAGRRVMAAVELLGLAEAASSDLEDSYVISYPAHASLAEHTDDVSMYSCRNVVRLTLSTHGYGEFASHVTGLVETHPGDLLVQDLNRPVTHGVPRVHGERAAAVWNFPARVIR